MDDYFYGRIDKLHRIVACIDQQREVCHIGGCAAIFPKHTIIGFVTHLHPNRGNAVGF